MPSLLDPYQAASVLGVTHWTIREYVKQGRIKAIRLGNRLRFEPAELQRFIEASKA